MYLWVVLATFITVLLSYNLSVRPDMDRAFAETKASVVIAKFKALHNGVKDYLNSQAPEKTGQARVTYYPGTGVNVSTPEGSQASSLTVDDIRNYLPVGYIKADETLDDIANITGGGKIVSKVFCFDEGETSIQCTSGVDGSCCSNECITDDNCSSIYVVSFTQMPTRWINKISNMPNADMMGALTHIRGYGKDIGYTDIKNGKVILSGGQAVQHYDEHGNPVGERAFESFEIFGAIKNDADFQDMGCDKENVHCLFAIQQIYG